MKKTIAILLVLVIGMAGVWASTADILLTTVIDPINQMAIVAKDTVLASYGWPEGSTATPTSTEGTSSIYGTTLNAYDVADNAGTTSVTIAKLLARTNNRGGVNITVDATSLTDAAAAPAASADSKNIDYSLEVGTVAKINFVDGTKTVTSSAVGSLAYSDAIASNAWNINLKLDESLANAAAGTYNGSITLTYTAL